MSNPAAPISKARRSRIKRRLIMIAIGSSLGIFCRFAPLEYQDICKLAARVLGLLVGSP